jgi:signal peptidase I
MTPSRPPRTPVSVAAMRPLLEEALARGASVWWRPRGHSMWPAIADGDRILVAALHDETRLGDIVSFATAGGIAVHRVVAVRRAGRRRDVVVMGDNAPERLDAVPAERLIGRVVAVERAGRVRRIDGVLARALGAVKAVRCRRSYTGDRSTR